MKHYFQVQHPYLYIFIAIKLCVKVLGVRIPTLLAIFAIGVKFCVCMKANIRNDVEFANLICLLYLVGYAR